MTATHDERADLVKSAQTIIDGAQDREFTEDESTEVDTIIGKIRDLDTRTAKHAKDAESVAALKQLADSGSEDDDDTDTTLFISDRREKADVRTFGERFIKSTAYEAFRKEHPSGVGSGSPVSIGRVKVGTMDEWHRRKALTSPQAFVPEIRMPMVDQVDRNRLTLLDLVSRGQTAGNFEYVQVTGVTRNAAIVPEASSGSDDAALKPVSEMTTQLADAKVYTYADGYEVTNQLLADAPAFASYMNTELEYSLDSVVEDKLLNGSGASGEPRGILNTTGVQQQEYTPGADAMELVRAIRQGISKVTRLPAGTVTAVVLSPEDDEALDLMQDADQRFYSQGPFGNGPATIWGRPRVTSERLTPGQVLLGDFQQVALLDREGLSVLAFNQHKDFAQRNMTYVRAELRCAQVIWKPNRLVNVTPAAGV